MLCDTRGLSGPPVGVQKSAKQGFEGSHCSASSACRGWDSPAGIAEADAPLRESPQFDRGSSGFSQSLVWQSTNAELKRSSLKAELQQSKQGPPRLSAISPKSPGRRSPSRTTPSAASEPPTTRNTQRGPAATRGKPSAFSVQPAAFSGQTETTPQRGALCTPKG